MAKLIGCAAMSHAPQLMLNPDYWHLLNNRQGERLPDKPGLEKETQEVRWAKWNNCMTAIGKLREQVEALRPDVIIVVGDDQHENLIDDNMPPFTIYMGEEAEASLSLRYLNQPKSDNRTQYRVDAKMAERLSTAEMKLVRLFQETPMTALGPCVCALAQVSRPETALGSSVMVTRISAGARQTLRVRSSLARVLRQFRRER